MAIGASKLTDAEIINIFYLRSVGLKQEKIKDIINEGKVEKKKVTRSHVANILNGKRWNKKNNSYLMKSDIPRDILNFISETLSQHKMINTPSQQTSLNTEEITPQKKDINNEYKISLYDGKEINIKIQICYEI
jgi:glutamyl/glutaminyl-tRNA synthetase